MGQIASIQILRALAALMVVFSHVQADSFDTANRAGQHFAGFHMLPLNAGVDLFFVISGFIMVYASRRLFGTPRAGAQFMARRIARIVPLYWLATSLALILLGYEAARGKGAFPGVWEILASFGFIPFARPQDGLVQPVTGVGWTLNYEMFFYAVFALFVGLARTRAVPAVAASLALAVAAGALLKPSAVALAYWSDPIVLEFVLGMIVAVVFESGIRLKPFWSGSVIALALICLTLDFAHMAPFAPPPGYDPHGFIRLFAAGVPMAALFAAIVLVEAEIPTRGRVAAFLILLGDASYALYLFHPFTLVLTRKAYVGLGLVAKIGVLPLICIEIPLAIALAFAIHFAFEKPVSDNFHAWLRRKTSPQGDEGQRDGLMRRGGANRRQIPPLL